MLTNKLEERLGVRGSAEAMDCLTAAEIIAFVERKMSRLIGEVKEERQLGLNSLQRRHRKLSKTLRNMARQPDVNATRLMSYLQQYCAAIHFVQDVCLRENFDVLACTGSQPDALMRSYRSCSSRFLSSVSLPLLDLIEDPGQRLLVQKTVKAEWAFVMWQLHAGWIEHHDRLVVQRRHLLASPISGADDDNGSDPFAEAGFGEFDEANSVDHQENPSPAISDTDTLTVQICKQADVEHCLQQLKHKA